MEHHDPLINLYWFGTPIPMVITYEWLAMAVLILLAFQSTKSLKLKPDGLQNGAEWVYCGLKSFFCGIIGEKHGETFAPFCITLFLYIFTMNIMGVIPGQKSATEVFSNNFALGLLVFLYVQYSAVTYHGVGKYLFHLAGSPHDIIGYAMAPLMFVLHVVGELVRPFSLSLRLFGNIYGEEMVIAVFFSLIPLVVPVPFLLLACLTSLIQALVFSMLTAVYFSLALAEGH